MGKEQQSSYFGTIKNADRITEKRGGERANGKVYKLSMPWLIRAGKQ